MPVRVGLVNNGTSQRERKDSWERGITKEQQEERKNIWVMRLEMSSLSTSSSFFSIMNADINPSMSLFLRLNQISQVRLQSE